MSNFVFRSEETDGKEYILDVPGVTQDFLQFVPAMVREVINSTESAPNVASNPNECNFIIVEKNILTDDTTLAGFETKKYHPLFRGFNDSVVIGDLVLVTEIGNVGYYLGPLNASGAPSLSKNNLGTTRESGDVVSSTYPKINFTRLEKKFKPSLDDPKAIAPVFNYGGLPQNADIHTDLTLEGRHGNSIRIGSRNINPNIIISNGRSRNQSIESINDSSLFGMIHQGSLGEYFDSEQLDGENILFTLADESIAEPSLTIKSTFTSPLGRGFGIDGESDADIETTLYGYTSPQSILNSDRITINARKDNLFLSAFKHIHIGSGNTLTFSTSKNTLFNSSERFDINAPEVRLGSAIDDETQPLVRGDDLVSKLTELCDQLDQLISNIQAITVTTTQGPSGTPINAAAFNAQASGIRSVVESLEDFLSITNRTT